MNIFFLDKDPVKSAQMCVDRHCVKMVLELYQQLGSALRRHGATDNDMPLTKSGNPLKGAYPNHPCTLWCGDSRENFKWASNHAIALAEEYTWRYGKTHACEAGIHKMANMRNMIPEGKMTPPAQAMPEEYRNEDPVVAYRDYYFYDKRLSIDCSWNKTRSSPEWWNRMLVLEELTQQAQDLSMGYGQ